VSGAAGHFVRQRNYICTVEEFYERNKKYNVSTKGLSKQEKKRVLLSLDEDKFIRK
jgi:hypothetical protein